MNKKILELFKKEQQDVLRKLEELEGAVRSLRFEGKPSHGHSMRVVEKNVKFLKQKLFQHIAIDEEVIFPFVESHIPKLEPLFYFLRAERSEFALSLKNFEALFQKLQGEENGFIKGNIIHQLNEKGLYLICIMRNHIQLEIEGVYKPIEKQLRPEEKNDLCRRCLAFTAKAMVRKACLPSEGLSAGRPASLRKTNALTSA